MKVLITGATGFLGKRCCQVLNNLNFKIIASGRDLAKAKSLLSDGINFIAADLTERSSIDKIDSDIEAIVHCAALSSPWGKKEDFYKSNVLATQNLLDFGEKCKIRKFIYISSSSVYFNYKDRLSIKENDTLASPPPSNYTASKILAENILQSSQCESIILRPRGIFGPGDTAIVPRILAAHKKNKLPILGDGKALIDITYVDNVVQAIKLVLRSEANLNNEVFNISNDESIYIWDFLKQLFNKLDLEPPKKKVSYSAAYIYSYILELIGKYITHKEPSITPYTMALLARSQTLDISKAKSILAYKPLINMQEGMDKVVEDLKRGSK